MKRIFSYNLEDTYDCMRFSPDSKGLVIVTGSTYSKLYTTHIISLDGENVQGEGKFNIEEEEVR
jgi:hypothetical protein